MPKGMYMMREIEGNRGRDVQEIEYFESVLMRSGTVGGASSNSLIIAFTNHHGKPGVSVHAKGRNHGR